MEACSTHGDRAGGVKRNRTAVSVELKQAVCEYAQRRTAVHCDVDGLTYMYTSRRWLHCTGLYISI